MHRSWSALLTATLAIPVVGFTHAYLSAAPPPSPPNPWSISTQSTEQGGLWQGDARHQSDRWLAALNLTPDQQRQIRALQDSAQPAWVAQTEQLQTEQAVMQALMARGDASAEDLRSQHQVLQTLRQAMSANRLEVLLAIREQLTPQQRALLAAQLEAAQVEIAQLADHHHRGKLRDRQDLPTEINAELHRPH
jgi:protein CpxP